MTVPNGPGAFGQKVDDMLSIVVTKAEHDELTAAWRNVSKEASKSEVQRKAKEIYKNFPEILKALGPALGP